MLKRCCSLFSPVETMISTPATLIHPAEANASNTESHKNGGLSEGEERENATCLSGFIFLCNRSTKFDCYRYRVFGLPIGRKDVVLEIKPGTKLFLFDFELKRLYGVYEATSAGNLNLEPKAFEGKYPAQVKFRIFKECFPIPESSLKHVIKENYIGTKFKQELSGMQVTKLISSFRPLLASHALSNKSLPGAMPPLAMQNQLKFIGRLPAIDIPYSAEGKYRHIQPSAEPQPTLNVYYQEHLSYRKEASSYYGANPQPSFAEDVACRVQEPSYSRYTTLERGATHDEVTVLGRQYHRLPVQSEALHPNNAAAYNSTDHYISSSYHHFAHRSSNPAAPAQHTIGWHQQVPADFFPVQNEAFNQDNVSAYKSNVTVADQYTPSVVQAQPYASYHQLSGHSSNHAAPSQHTTSDSYQQVQYTTSVVQSQLQAAYLPQRIEGLDQHNVAPYYNPTVPAQHPSIPQQEVSSMNLPLQSEVLHRVNAAAYNSNPVAVDPYDPSGRPPSELGHAVSTPVESYFPYPVEDRPS